MASPAFLAAALAGCAALFGLGRRVEAAVAAVAIAGGVLWSNALAYNEVSLAPRGPAARARDDRPRLRRPGPGADDELRAVRRAAFPPPRGSRRAPRSCGAVSTTCGTGACSTRASRPTSTASLSTGSSTTGRSCLRRGPAASRPPSVYRLVRSGRYYEVWQRPAAGAPTILEHLSLGDARQAAAVPRCADVLRLARQADAAAGSLATATRPQAIPVATPSLSGTVTTQIVAPESRALHGLARRRLVRAVVRLRRRARGRREARGAELARALHRPRKRRARSRDAHGRPLVRHRRVASRQRRRAVRVRAAHAQPRGRARARAESAAVGSSEPLWATSRLDRGGALAADELSTRLPRRGRTLPRDDHPRRNHYGWRAAHAALAPPWIRIAAD